MGFLRWRLSRALRAGVKTLQDRKVADIMTKYVVTILPEKSVLDAAAVMIGEDVSALVVEQASKPVGILTERDFITKTPATKKALTLKVRDVMSCSFSGKREKVCAVEAVAPEATLLEAMAVLRQRNIRKLVVTKDDLIAGIVTQTDMSKELYRSVRSVTRFSDCPFLVKDVMTATVASCAKTSSFSSAKELMKRRNVSALPVAEKGGYIGIFTEYDVVAQFYDTDGRLDIKMVEQIMHSPIKAIPSSLNIFDANTVMLFEKVRRLLVLDEGKVVGIVTQTDLVRACYEYLERLLKALDGGTPIEEIVPLRRSESIISQYVSEHIRMYTMKGQ